MLKTTTAKILSRPLKQEVHCFVSNSSDSYHFVREKVVTVYKGALIMFNTWMCVRDSESSHEAAGGF